jgi:hypothetical protein
MEGLQCRLFLRGDWTGWEYTERSGKTVEQEGGGDMNEEHWKQLEHEAFERFKDGLEMLGYKVEFSEDEAIEIAKMAIANRRIIQRREHEAHIL